MSREEELREKIARLLHGIYSEGPHSWEQLVETKGVWLKDADAILALLPPDTTAPGVPKGCIIACALGGCGRPYDDGPCPAINCPLRDPAPEHMKRGEA